jgi:hypothetical protein
MAILEIPVRDDLPSYNFQITLEGIVFTLHFRFNVRDDRWYMDVNDVDDEPIVTGVKLLYGLPLLDRYKNERLPLGRFIILDETGEERNPTRDGLGVDFKLLYRESTT